MPVAKSLALATVLILGLPTWIDAAPINQSGYSRRVPTQGGGKVAKIPCTTTLRFRPGVAKGSVGARRASWRCSTWMNRDGPIGKLPCAQMLA
jgi:hypothetical protein